MRRTVLAMAAVLLSAAIVPADEELRGDAKRLLDSAWRMGRSTRFSTYHRERLAKALGEVTTEELGKVIDALRTREEPGRSLAEVLDYLTGVHVERRFGPEAAETIPDLAEKLRGEKPGDRMALLSGSLFLEDLRLATHLAMSGAKDEDAGVRYRAAYALGDLVNYGVGEEGLLVSLEELLFDDEPSVRIAACRRAFEVGMDGVFEWALSHLGDQAKAKISVAGEEVVTSPGEEALRRLTELTWVQRELTHREFLRLSAERRKVLLDLFCAWWKEVGETFPAPGFREAKFRERPSTEKTVIVASGRTTASLNLWAALDRTRIRVSVDEVECTASSAWEFDVNFHFRYMAQGMRIGDGEAYRRHFPVGERYVLARKAIGCFVVVFQVLSGDRLKLHFRFHDPLR